MARIFCFTIGTFCFFFFLAETGRILTTAPATTVYQAMEISLYKITVWLCFLSGVILYAAGSLMVYLNRIHRTLEAHLAALKPESATASSLLATAFALAQQGAPKPEPAAAAASSLPPSATTPPVAPKDFAL